MKYMGMRTVSQKTKNSTRSRATKVPFMPVSSRSSRARKALGLRGSGRIRHE
jgi:hypothetical protein